MISGDATPVLATTSTLVCSPREIWVCRLNQYHLPIAFLHIQSGRGPPRVHSCDESCAILKGDHWPAAFPGFSSQSPCLIRPSPRVSIPSLKLPATVSSRSYTKFGHMVRPELLDSSRSQTLPRGCRPRATHTFPSCRPSWPF